MAMNLWSTVTWDLARAGGLTAYVLLTLSILLGLTLSIRWQNAQWPRLITNDMHRFVTLLTLVFIVVHGLASWLDPFMRFGWMEILVPFMSHYRPMWMALGIVAGYLGAALWISTELRPWIGYTLWRRLHGVSFAVYVLATVHGLATGSDTRDTWALALYGASVLVVGTLLCYRLLTPIGTRGRTYPNLAGLVALLVLGGAIWTVSGPARSGWNAIANNGQGNGARNQQAAAQGTNGSPISQTSSTISGWTGPFSANLRGSLTQRTDASTGGVTLQLNTTLSGGTQGSFQVLLQGTPSGDGSVAVTQGRVALSGPSGTPSYQGTVQGLQDDDSGLHLSAMLRKPNGQSLSVQATLQLSPTGQVGGVVQASPA
jgi:hypothetical protein